MVIDIALLGSDFAVSAVNLVNISPGTVIVLTFVVNLALFFLSLWIFSFLIEKKNWARIVLIVIGWLAVIDFISSALFLSKSSDMLKRIYGDIDWEGLLVFDVISDFLAVIFWAYAIYLLMFNQKVTQMFNSPQSSVHRPQD